MKRLFYILLSGLVISAAMPVYACVSKEIQDSFFKDVLPWQNSASHIFICHQAKLMHQQPIEEERRIAHLARIFSQENYQQVCAWEGCGFHGKAALNKNRKKTVNSVVLLASCNNNRAAAYLIAGLYNEIPYGLFLDLKKYHIVQKLLQAINSQRNFVQPPQELSKVVQAALATCQLFNRAQDHFIASLLFDSGLLNKQERYDILMNCEKEKSYCLLERCKANHGNRESDRFEKFKRAITWRNYEEAHLWLNSGIIAPFVNAVYGDRQVWAEKVFKKAHNRQQLLPFLGDFLSEQTLIDYVAAFKYAKKDSYAPVFIHIKRNIRHMSWKRAINTAALLKPALEKASCKEALLSLIDPLSTAIKLRPAKQMLDKNEENIHLLLMHPLADMASKEKAVKLFKSFPQRHASFYKDCLAWLFLNPVPLKVWQEASQKGVEYLIKVLSKPKNKKALLNRFLEEEKIDAYQQPALIKKNQWPAKLVIHGLSVGFLWNELKYYISTLDTPYLNNACRELTNEELSTVLSNLHKTLYVHKHNQLDKTRNTLQQLRAVFQEQATARSSKVELS